MQINGDIFDEPNETFDVTLFNPSNATIATDTATMTITDNDLAGRHGCQRNRD